MWPMLKLKLSYCDLSDQVWFMMKCEQGNNLTDHIGVVYTGNET